MGCRFIDGTGQLIARQTSMEACTRSDEAFGFGFVDRGSRIQFCGLIATAWSFPLGDTVVAARSKDGEEGEFGAQREIVVRIGEPTPATVTFTPTASPTPAPPTPTATKTRIPPTKTPPTIRVTAPPRGRARRAVRRRRRTTGGTPSPGAYCACDCNEDRIVSIADLTQVVNIIIGDQPLENCPEADANEDAVVTIGDVIVGVNNALSGCP